MERPSLVSALISVVERAVAPRGPRSEQRSRRHGLGHRRVARRELVRQQAAPFVAATTRKSLLALKDLIEAGRVAPARTRKEEQ
jgi:hypothetical protein